MSKEYDIYIHHSVSDTEQSAQDSSASIISGQTSSPASAQKKVVKTAASGSSVAKIVGIQLGKKALQYATSNYGNLTGDYIGQAQISEGLEIAGYVGIIAASPILGTAAVATSIGIKAINRTVEIKKQRQEVEILSARTGRVISGGGRI